MEYLAYGSNMDAKIMKGRCPQAKFLGTGILENMRLLFKGEEPNAYATIEEWKGYSVPYVLWEITEDDAKNLSALAEKTPYEYQMRRTIIEYDDELYTVIFFAKSAELPVGQPMTHYVEVLEEAYEKFKFDEKILEEALRFSDEYYQRKRN